MWNKDKIIKTAVILVCIFLGVALLTINQKRSSMTLSEYAAQYPDKAYGTIEAP